MAGQPPTASRCPLTAVCRRRLPTGSARHRSGCTCMCRSARPGAVTATSTPTRPRSWALARPASPTQHLAIAEIRQAGRVLAGRSGPVQTVFFGGGTPTLLPPADLVAILRAIDAELGLAPHAEVTTEANPETVDERMLADLRAGGFTRISLGMQSAVPHVLAVWTACTAQVGQSSAWAGRGRPASTTSAWT